jgi:hypothetical protein
VGALGLGFVPAAAVARPKLRNSLGYPDLEGVWSSLTATRLERPKEFNSQWGTSDQARAVLERRAKPPAAEDDKVGQFTSEWWADEAFTVIDGRILTSFLVDPPDGKLPYSKEGRAVMEAKVQAMAEDSSGVDARDTFERCLYGIGGPPLGSASIGPMFKILQTRDQVAILSELMHDMRLIRLGSREGPEIPSWTGASFGRYEGHTLIVETKGFHPLLTMRDGDFYLSPNAVVRERFRRISERQILYEYEVEDPAIYTQVWRAMMVLSRSDAPMFEYACHEGNYGLTDILAGAREEEKAHKDPR